MHIWDLKQKIENKDIPNLIIMAGEERSLIQIYINQIEEVFLTRKINYNSVQEAFNASLHKDLLGSDVRLMCVKDDAAFKSDDTYNLWSKITSIKSVLILTYTGIIDKRSKFYNTFENNIVTFDRMNEDMIVDVICSQISIKKDYVKWIVQSCGCDYGRCIQEVDKVKIFDDGETDLNSIFYSFAKNNVFHVDIPDCVFDFTNAVMRRNISESFLILEDLKLRGDSPIQVLGLLYNNFRNMISVQLCDNPTLETTGLEEKQINAIKRNKGKYTDRELIDAITLICNLDSDIKIGIISDVLALDYFIARVI